MKIKSACYLCRNQILPEEGTAKQNLKPKTSNPHSCNKCSNNKFKGKCPIYGQILCVSQKVN